MRSMVWVICRAGISGVGLFTIRKRNVTTLARFTTDANAAGAKQYLAVLSASLKTKAAAVSNAWSASGGNYLKTFINATGVDAGSSLSLMVNAYVLDFDVNLQNFKIGIPIGLYGPSVLPKSPAKVEAYYSGLSTQLLIAAGAGISEYIYAEDWMIKWRLHRQSITGSH